MKIPIIGICIALAGCSGYPTLAQFTAEAKEETTPNLCAVTLMAPPLKVMNIAENEIRARGATCDWQQAQAIAATQLTRIQQQREAQQAENDAKEAKREADREAQRLWWQQNGAAMLNAGAALMQQSRPHYYASPPTQTTCVQQGAFTNCTSY